jgi:hypothetical protein
MRIAYHGTTSKNAKSILREGLKKDSYYTPFLDTALSQGGPVIFIWYILDPVYEELILSGQWQFRTEKIMSLDEFVAIVHYKNVKLIHYNKNLNQELRIKDNPEICFYCQGAGELNYPDDGHCYLPGGSSIRTMNIRKIEQCPKCKGYGSIENIKDVANAQFVENMGMEK